MKTENENKVQNALKMISEAISTLPEGKPPVDAYARLIKERLYIFERVSTSGFNDPFSMEQKKLVALDIAALMTKYMVEEL